MKLGVQLYTLRSQFEQDVPATLNSLAAMGLQYVELAGTYGLAAREFRAMLDGEGLEAVGAHVGLDALRGSLWETLEDARVLGCRFIVLPWIAAEEYAPGWEAVGRSLGEIGRQVVSAGFGFAYHNHAFELVDDGGRSGLETLFASCDPEAVQAEIDVAWVYHAGYDPTVTVRDLAGRVPLVHLKDFTDDPEALDIAAGQGSLDWEAILAACASSGVEYGFIELDHPPKTPSESVRECVEFFRGRGLT